MLAGLLIYLAGQRYLPPEPQRLAHPLAPREAGSGFDRQTVMVLLGVGVAVTVFRSAYEQIGNTVALWADTGLDRHAGKFDIPMTWFQSLNPLFVMLMTPPLLAYWARRARQGADQPPALRMAQGALILSAAYLLLAGVTWVSSAARTEWGWLALFFVFFTFGELFILPTGLGLFARLAPPGLGATTVGAWFLIIFSGSLSAGLVGRLYSSMSHPGFFCLLATLAALSAAFLWLLNPATERVDGHRRTKS